MKKYLLLFVLGLVTLTLSAQELQLQNGKAYKNGELFSGVEVTLFNGSSQTDTETNYSKGLKDGTETFYYENGNKKALRIWAKGLKDGIWMNWDESGNKTAQASYSKNVKHGDWFIWSSGGIMLFEMHYKDGEKVGKWLQWDEAGNLIMEKNF